jgi:hypothetical protein
MALTGVVSAIVNAVALLLLIWGLHHWKRSPERTELTKVPAE